MPANLLPTLRPARVAWNRGRIIGQKRPLLQRHVWSIRVRLEIAGNARDLALFNMAVDSKTARLRSRRPPGPRCLRRRTGQGADLDDPKQDRQARPVRNH